MDWLTDIWNSIYAIFATADWITLLIIGVVVLGVGFMTESLATIITSTFIALVVYAVAQFVRAIATGGANASALAQADWHTFLAWPMQGFIAYAIAFAVLIAIVSLLRTLVLR
ncbi:MAG TPA: hypothetical protein VHW02_13570 [Rhizomicrobium sp.]|jgi:hypothetical protein|nr:hypothetical protein [Rhizomicrobium sp.]